MESEDVTSYAGESMVASLGASSGHADRLINQAKKKKCNNSPVTVWLIYEITF